MASIGVIGAGTWGTALAVLLHGKGHQTEIWSAIRKEVEGLSSARIHPNLPELRIPDEIGVTAEEGTNYN